MLIRVIIVLLCKYLVLRMTVERERIKAEKDPDRMAAVQVRSTKILVEVKDKQVEVEDSKKTI